ncbi:type II toxin-antitoxin system VapC family toxin [Sphingomonas koreensis]|nr:type II toxin-antitoxin system VapC family toxin [Sphingomonas koreensis]
MRYLLDTNVVVDWLVNADRRIVHRLIEHRGEIALSAIVMHELYFGAFNSARIDRNLADFRDIGLPILAFEEQDARAAGEIRALLRREGRPIGPYDVLIAGQARARGLIVVTANTSEFSRVPDLRIEDWTA